MKKLIRRGAHLCAVLSLLAPLASGTQPVQAQALTVLHVAALPTDNSGNVYFALDLGYFKNAGLDVQIETVANGAATAAGLAAGSIDVAQSIVTATASAHLRGIDLKLFAPSANTVPGSQTNAIVVPKDSPVKTAADLNGKTFGILNLKSIQQVMAMAWVDKHGGDSKTLKFIEIPYPQMAPALAQHLVDAVIVVEPFLTFAKTPGRVIANPEDAIAPSFVAIAWGATGAWLQTHADVAKRFTAAVRQASVWANAHPVESADILIKYSKIDPALMHSMARSVNATTLDAALVQPELDVAAKYGAIDHTFPASEILWAPPK